MSTNGPRPPMWTPDRRVEPGDGVYGMQILGGQFVVQASHHCGKIGCDRPAFVAVFGMNATDRVIRMNVCREHVVAALGGELRDGWIAALLADRERGEYCPHCCARVIQADGTGHLSVCPIGLTYPRYGAIPHDRGECEVCLAYRERRPGPVG